jgi:ABC-type Fe3+-hydroxamate transport system substrate-binding protein
MGDMSETTRVTEEQKRAAAALWAQYPSLRAARSGGVHAVASDIYVVPGPRLVEAAKAFAQILHPAGKQ